MYSKQQLIDVCVDRVNAACTQTPLRTAYGTLLTEGAGYYNTPTAIALRIQC
jgi:hypothetical protein